MQKSKSYETHTQLGNIKQPKADIVHTCNKVHCLLNCEDIRYPSKRYPLKSLHFTQQVEKKKNHFLEWYINVRKTRCFWMMHITLQPLILPLNSNNKNKKCQYCERKAKLLSHECVNHLGKRARAWGEGGCFFLFIPALLFKKAAALMVWLIDETQQSSS